MRAPLAALPLSALVLAGLVGCGTDSSGSADASASDPNAVPGVAVTGSFGEEPKIEIDELDVKEPVDGVVIEGDGVELSAASKINYRFQLVHGANGKEVSGNYAEEADQQLDLSQQPAAITDALVGTKVGSRVVIALPVNDLVGEGQASQYGLKGKDDLIMVMDLVSETEKPLEGPEGDAVDPPSDAPTVLEDEGAVAGLDFKDAAAKPSDDLQVIPLIEGAGETIVEGDSVTVDYYGAVYGEDQAFDESYSAEPVTFTLAQGSLIDGWVQGLEGVKAGSRVMLIIPAELGYGSQGSGDTIPPGSTLVFVIDVLGVNL